MAAYSLIKTVNTGDTITAVDRNNEHQNHINNNTCAGVTGDSANVAGMQTTVSPGGVGTESLATTLQGEIERLRYVIKTLHGGAQWYPGQALLPLAGGTMTGAIAMGGNNVSGVGILSFNNNGTGGITGTTAADSAPAGAVGEYVESVVSSVNFPATNNWGDLTSISLTAGDWDVTLQSNANINGASWANASVGISTTTGNSATGLTLGSNYARHLFAGSTTTPTDVNLVVANFRVNISGTTTYYAKMLSTWSVANPIISGRLCARRRR